MNQLFAFVLLIASVVHFRTSETTSELLIDPEYKGNITIYDQPSGKVIAAVKQNFDEEDFLFLTATKQTTDFFYGTLEYSISGKQGKGWIKKGKFIGIYARNYDAGKTLSLYAEPRKSSKTTFTIQNYDNRLYQVTSINKGWVYVKVEHQGKIKQGWLAPDMQCANAYSTCN
ncbi:hypothetical protein [Pontibacter akesuensis]|uniref:SH3 domain-containing protein n=1 Tax=Pontibacter akesuensis TaxID=388950 RepID=A0A1I7FFM9_9BACT|nr:hypothetical protein [Pontibacter akesuensis]GHA62359.1 hypothetical protein GCM10007389_13890 [Pontibacter akesuensis]SFU35002.1 hypothetical protein SAMN04487941_0167 [Pontibacter akesuensis]